jgi:membrane-associated phospholipid phosphatase
VGWLGEDALIIGEAVLLSTFTNQAVKYSLGRVRPYAHAAWQRRSQPAGLPVDDHLSFYSGHTSYAFSLVVATGMVAELRGYARRSLVWAVGLPLATAVGLLRVAGDKHYLTDVVVGMAAGAAFGVAVPLLLHGRQRPFRDVSLQVVATPGGAALVGQF